MTARKKPGRPSTDPAERRVKINYTLSPDLIALIKAKSKTTKKSQSAIVEECMRRELEMTDTPAATPSVVALPSPLPPAPVPVKVPAARGEFWLDLYGGIAAGQPIDFIAQEPIPVAKEYPEDHYAYRVFGQSMEPKIKDGSVIVVKQWGTAKGFPKKGTIVVYSDGSGITLKEFGYRKAGPDEEADTFGNVPVLRSLNKAFPDVQTMEGGRIEAIFVESL